MPMTHEELRSIHNGGRDLIQLLPMSMHDLLTEFDAVVAERDIFATMNGRLRTENELRRKQMSRFPFCPDHRDKVYGKPCIECEIESLRAENEKLRAGLLSVSELIANSDGVDGLHLNGDIATWNELMPPGRFEEWLAAFSEARKLPGRE